MAQSRNLDLVEVELFRAGKRQVIRVYLDREGGISLDECAAASEDLSVLLDADELFGEDYTLEVSSPGLDRPLRTPRDWARRKGSWIRVVLTEQVGGKKGWIGRLVRCDEESAVLVTEKGQELQIPYRVVQLARVDVRLQE